MTLLHVRIDSKEVNKILGNAIKFNYGFLEGIELEQIPFHEKLAEFTKIALMKYIDAQARGNPSAFHHLYEWGQVGQDNARLFDINSKVSKRVIHFGGKFLPSSSENPDGYVFREKANIMENQIAVTVSPVNSNVLVFEVDGETVFTTNSVYIAHPGGDAVAGTFGRTVEEFFNSYFTGAFLAPLIKDLATPDEYARMFPRGAKGGGAKMGRMAAKEYMKIKALGEIQ